MRTEERIFKDGSPTYYWSSRLFSPKVRADLIKLCSFVRLAKEFVDVKPQNAKALKKLEKLLRAKNPTKVTDEITLVAANMRQISVKYSFDNKWVYSFLEAMHNDTKPIIYRNQKNTFKYMHGSAEVVGLMILAIVRPDLRKGPDAKKAQHYAELQSKAMQYIGFIRDINEYQKINRCYFAKNDLEFYGLDSLSPNVALRHPAEFREFVQDQVKLYEQWQKEANKGLSLIPWRERIALRTVVDMNNWTAKKISADPDIIYNKQIKPSKVRIITQTLYRLIYA